MYLILITQYLHQGSVRQALSKGREDHHHLLHRQLGRPGTDFDICCVYVDQHSRYRKNRILWLLIYWCCKMIYCDKSQIVTIVYCVTIYDYYCTTLSNIQHIKSSFGNSAKFFKAKKLRNKLIIQETDGRISHPSLTSDVAGSVHGVLADQRRRGALPRRPGHPRSHHPPPPPHHSASLRCRFSGMCVGGIYSSKVCFQGFC